jgi:hypothetical protein
VLITGGSQGIGLGLANGMAARGDAVLVTGRSVDRLGRIAGEHPDITTFVNDVSEADECVRLAEHVRQVMPDLDMVSGRQLRSKVSSSRSTGCGAVWRSSSPTTSTTVADRIGTVFSCINGCAAGAPSNAFPLPRRFIGRPYDQPSRGGPDVAHCVPDEQDQCRHRVAENSARSCWIGQDEQ